MAIQLPDVGTGVPADQTGDSPWLAMKKVRENFNDQTNAASRLVGGADNNLPTVSQVKDMALRTKSIAPADLAAADNGAYLISAVASDVTNGSAPRTGRGIVHKMNMDQNYGVELYISTHTATPSMYVRNHAGRSSSPVSSKEWKPVYNGYNTTLDANGFIKAASPIVKVFADKVELNGEAEDQNVTYKKNGVGDYTITTVSGLSTDGWYIELPKDMNGNPKVAVTLLEVDGVISLKSYKRIFSMESFTFEPDLDNPLDIPDGRWIDLRLNEIPFEAQEELPTDGG